MSNANNWRDSAVRDRLKYVLTNENTGQDVVIVVGCGSTETKIKTHSFMLFNASPVLEKLLQQAKINNEGMKDIKLHDIRPEAMKFVLKHIYTDYSELENEDGIDILYASLKLNLHSLAANCIGKLKNEISAANVLRIFEESAKMNVEELVQESQQFVFKNAREVFQSEQFVRLTNESLCKLLAFDEMEMDETSIFKSIISWGKAECDRSELEKTSENLRFVLKKVVPLIRFTLISIHEFATVVVPTNLLDHQEVIDVFTYLSVKSDNANEPVEHPLWISSSSERKLKCGTRDTSLTNSNNISTDQAANDGNHHVYIQPRRSNKDKLLEFMKNISGKNTISGLFAEHIQMDCNRSIQTIHDIAGVRPGILTLTMPSCMDGMDKWKSFTEEIISNWNNGYLVNIVWWNRRHALAQSKIFKIRDDNKWNDLINDGGDSNREWKKQLDALVPYLNQLQDAGVAVICDFLPLINNKGYPWGGRPGVSGSLKLYQITHDYMTQKHHLHSLLWTLSFSQKSDMSNLEQFWPGNEYVDVVSVYMGIAKQLGMNEYHKLLEVVGDKPISMECISTVPSLEILDLQPQWMWFTTPDNTWEDAFYNTNANVKTTFKGPSIINKENNEFFNTLNSN